MVAAPQMSLFLQQRLEAVPALAEEHRILAAGLAPGDEVLARVGRRVEVPAIGLDGRGRRPVRTRAGGGQRCRAGDESASLQYILLGAGPGGRTAEKPGDSGRPRSELIRELWRICQCGSGRVALASAAQKAVTGRFTQHDAH